MHALAAVPICRRVPPERPSEESPFVGAFDANDSQGGAIPPLHQIGALEHLELLHNLLIHFGADAAPPCHWTA